MQRDKFCKEFVILVSKSKASDTVVVAGDFDVQVVEPVASEACLSGCCGLLAQQTDYGNIFVQTIVYFSLSRIPDTIHIGQ